MRIIKLDAIDSTNSYLRNLSVTEELDDYTIVITDKQTNGRGQMGTTWHSNTSKNLTVSVFKDIRFLTFNNQYYLNIVVALSVVKLLNSLNIPKLSIKWPNDILSENKKICGILIENVIKQNVLSSSVIGVGLNVNQIEFEGLPRASSLKLILGKNFNLEELLFAFITNLKHYFSVLKNSKHSLLKAEYESLLFKKGKPSTFKSAQGQLFSGFISGVSQEGCLQVLLEDNNLQSFSLKEIELLY